MNGVLWADAGDTRLKRFFRKYHFVIFWYKTDFKLKNQHYDKTIDLKPIQKSTKQ